jgi:predicted membrane channel-forming protein YqfA (hemolysin III family)
MKLTGENSMKLVGILVAIAGWLIPVIGLTFTHSNSARLILCIVGIGISLVGVLGVLNKAHQKEAVWKKS